MKIQKLTGQAYLDHWLARIARGPEEAGTVQNGNDTWNFIKGFLPADFEPASILEFGCGYGRMLRHLHERWPAARLYGVDLSRAALDHLRQNWEFEPLRLFNQAVPPARIHADLIFTCTVLQHVTDDEILQAIVEGFRKILNIEGYLIMYENVTYAQGNGGAHMREFGAKDYMRLWPEWLWKDCGTFMHGREMHELMIGQKAS